MFRVAGKVLDVYDDLKLELLKENLDKVGKLKLAAVDQVGSLSDDQFALVFLTKTGRAIRKYPIHDRDSTLVSSLYFEKMASKLPPEAKEIAATFLKKAYQRHGIQTPEVLEKFAGEEISTNRISVRDCSALGTEAPQAYALGEQYPIDTETEVKSACAYFDENYGNLRPADRCEFASNVTARATELKAEIPETSFINKYAGDDYGNLVESAYHERVDAIGQDEMAVRALRHLFDKKASFQPREFAEKLAQFDVTNKLDRYWDRGNLGIRDPFRSTFEHIKIASKLVVGNHSISPDKVIKLANSDALKETFDEDFCEKFAEAPVEIFQSLPRPEQELIISLAEAN